MLYNPLSFDSTNAEEPIITGFSRIFYSSSRNTRDVSLWYARKVKSGFIVSTISRWRIKASATQCLGTAGRIRAQWKAHTRRARRSKNAEAFSNYTNCSYTIVFFDCPFPVFRIGLCHLDNLFIFTSVIISQSVLNPNVSWSASVRSVCVCRYVIELFTGTEHHHRLQSL